MSEDRITGDEYILDRLQRKPVELREGHTYDVPDKDPWKHRSVRMRCNTCMWFVPKEGDPSSNPLGRCRRHAPTLNGYPAVFSVDWCGDHKMDEEKIHA